MEGVIWFKLDFPLHENMCNDLSRPEGGSMLLSGQKSSDRSLGFLLIFLCNLSFFVIQYDIYKNKYVSDHNYETQNTFGSDRGGTKPYTAIYLHPQ
jgi:hypothetical protein